MFFYVTCRIRVLSMKRIYIATLVSFLLTFVYSVSAQETVNKTHYRIINENFESTLNYEKALEHTQLDNLRYFNKRRQIPIEGTGIIIELFSAEELLYSYGKPISPLTIKDISNAPFVKFQLASNKYSLETLPKMPLEVNTYITQKENKKKDVATNFGSVLFDSGGLEGNYSSNEVYTKTIYSDNEESPYLNFTSFSVENHFDFIYIYDGPDMQSKLIGVYSGGNDPKIVKATGAYLTIVFMSDGSKTGGGWNAIVGRGTPPPPPSPMSAATCATSDPFCTGTTYTFPATTGNAPSETGPSYGCLTTHPNPAWYYLQVANSGNIVLSIAGSGGNDVDFVCWGPFTTATGACDAGLSGSCSGDHNCSGNIVDCSYSTSATETCTIPNGITGQFYMVLITNFADVAQNIIFNQVGGSGSTNCAIVAPCTISATNTGPYCAGQTISIAATSTATGTYSWAGPGGFTGTGANVTIPASTAAMSGTYTVTLVAGTSTCTATTIVTVNSPPTPSITGANIICNGASTILTTGGGGTYLWNTGATTAAITVNPTSNTTYTVTVTAANTCTAIATQLVTVNSLPTVTVNNATICPGGTATLTANGATTYNWTAGVTPTTGGIVTASPSVTTSYTVTGTTGTCTNSAIATITIGAGVGVTVNNATMCAGTSTVLTAGGATTYSWAPAAGLSATIGTTVTANPGTTTTYTVTGNTGGCMGTATSLVTINPNPIVTASSTSVCAGNAGTITAGGATTYSWNTGATTTAITESPTTTTSYTVTGTTNTCTNTAVGIVTVVPNPTVTVNNSTICTGTTATLTATGATTYSWNTGAITNPITESPPTGITSYTVTGTTNTCTNSAVATVTVVPSLTVTASNSTICIGSTATLTANGAATYLWNTGATTNPITISPIVTTTYTVLGTAGTCTASGTGVVTVNPLPIITANTATICIGQQTATLTAAGANTYVWAPAINIVPTIGAVVDANPPATQNYTITGTDAHGCVNTGTTSVSVNSLPTITATSTSVCPTFAGTIIAGGANTYTWNTTTTGAALTQTPVATTNYTVLGTDMNGCVDSAFGTIYVFPTLAITVNSSTICAGQQTATLSASGAVNYAWNPIIDLTPTAGSIVAATPAATTIYTVTGSVGTCTANATATVTVNAPPILTITGSTICVGQQIGTLGVSGASTYTWSGGGITGSNATNPTDNPINTTIYTVNGTDVNTCTAIATGIITVNPLPIVTATSGTVCIGQQTVTITANGANTYAWAPATGLSATTGSSVLASPLSTQNYVITGTDINGCTSTANSSVLVNPLPIITATSVSVCPTFAGTMTASGANTYTWSTFATGAILTQAPTVTTSYTVAGTDINGCLNATTATITVYPSPLPVATSNTPCANQTLNLACTPNGLVSYNWTGPNSYSNSTQNPSITGVTATTAGIYTVIVVDGNGCVNSNTINVIINPLPMVTVTGATVCVNQTITLSCLPNGDIYSWSNAGIAFSNLQNPSIPNATVGMSGNYVVTVTDGNGCTNGNVAEVLVHPLPIITAASATICAGQQIATLTASGANTYNWAPTTGLAPVTGSVVSANPSSTQDYTITGTDINGCVNTTTTNVLVNPPPIVITNTISPDCIPLCPTFSATSIPAASSYNWSFGNGQSSTQAIPTTCYTISANFPVRLIVTDIQGCVGTASTTVTTFAIPVADFDYGEQPVSISAPEVQFFNESTPGLPHYDWNFGDIYSSLANDTSMLINPSHLYSVVDTFFVKLTVSTASGCSAKVTKPIVINEMYALYVPNAFTPNSDGKNEVFKAEGEGINNFKMYIYDRWGLLIFYTEDINKGWDGTYQAKGSQILQEDLYVWKIQATDFKNMPRNLHGTVTLIK